MIFKFICSITCSINYSVSTSARSVVIFFTHKRTHSLSWCDDDCPAFFFRTKSTSVQRPRRPEVQDQVEKVHHLGDNLAFFDQGSGLQPPTSTSSSGWFPMNEVCQPRARASVDVRGRCTEVDFVWKNGQISLSFWTIIANATFFRILNIDFIEFRLWRLRWLCPTEGTLEDFAGTLGGKRRGL